MASGTLYEVERIVAKRKNRKGKWEYLIRWKGYGKSEDTWEPKHHLRHCEEFIHQFNRPPVHQDRRSRQGKPSAGPRFLSQAAGVSGGAKKRRAVGSQKQRRVGPSKPAGEGLTAVDTYGNAPVGLQFVSDANSRCGLQNGDADALRYRDANGAPIIPNNRLDEAREEVRVTEVPLLPELETSSPLSNGGANLHSPMKRQLAEDRGCAFDKRLRYNVRQNESSCRYRDIVVRREEGFTHVLLSSQTSENNALTPEIMKEVSRALGNAAVDDSKLLLLSAVGSIFCGGLDFSHLIGRLSADRRKESARVAEAIRDFVQAFIRFKKPIVVAINGPALGLGASILPLCDIVWASEKAWFQTPYATICLTPVGCSSYTFPQILGVALANDMLFCGRKLTAQEACSRGLVSQVFWPTTFTQEVMLRVKEMAMCSAVVLEESKCLVRNFLRSVLEEVNERECEMLKQLWSSTKGLDTLFTYLQEKAYAV